MFLYMMCVERRLDPPPNYILMHDIKRILCLRSYLHTWFI